MESQQMTFRETAIKDENYEKKGKRPALGQTVTARALRGKREKSLVPWSPSKHAIKGRENPC